MPSKRVIYTFATLFLVVAGWLWWLGRDTSAPAPVASSNDLASSTANLPSTLVSNWPARETALQTNLAGEFASGTKPVQFNLNSLAESSKSITQANLTVVKAATSSVQAYGAALAKALAPYAAPRGNELTILGQIYDTQDQTLVGALTAARELHQTVLSNLLTVPVPTDALALHLALTNDLRLLVQLAKNMEQVTSQPLLALQSGQVYQLAEVNFYSQLGILNNYFTKWGITFDPRNKITIFVNTQ